MDPPLLRVRLQPPIRAPTLLAVVQCVLSVGALFIRKQHSVKRLCGPFSCGIIAAGIQY